MQTSWPSIRTSTILLVEISSNPSYFRPPKVDCTPEKSYFVDQILKSPSKELLVGSEKRLKKHTELFKNRSAYQQVFQRDIPACLGARTPSLNIKIARAVEQPSQTAE